MATPETVRSSSTGTVLLAGTGEAMLDALRQGLRRRGLTVATAELDKTVSAALALAPDLIVLTGDAVGKNTRELLANLAVSTQTSVIPVALLTEESGLGGHLKAFRHGAVSVIAREASADAIAEQIKTLVSDVPQRPGQFRGPLLETTFDELVRALTGELRSGILSVKSRDEESDSKPMRLVFRGGKPVSEAIEGFVARLQPLVQAAEPLHYEFQEEAAGRLGVLDPSDADTLADSSLPPGLRLLLVSNDPGTSDLLAQALRREQAVVAVSDGQGSALQRVRGLDPAIVLVDKAGFEQQGFEAIVKLRRDLRLRWASVLIADWKGLVPGSAVGPGVGRLAARLVKTLEPDTQLLKLARQLDRFDTRLETLGPSRLLRALTSTGRTLHMSVVNRRTAVDVDLAERLIVGAHAELAEPAKQFDGASALAVLLALGSGRVHVEQRGMPSLANLMLPVDDALSAAEHEPVPIKVSELPATAARVDELPAALPAWHEPVAPDPTAATDLDATPSATEETASDEIDRALSVLDLPAPSDASSDAASMPVLSDRPTMHAPTPVSQRPTVAETSPFVSEQSQAAASVPASDAPWSEQPGRLPGVRLGEREETTQPRASAPAAGEPSGPVASPGPPVEPSQPQAAGDEAAAGDGAGSTDHVTGGDTVTAEQRKSSLTFNLGDDDLELEDEITEIRHSPGPPSGADPSPPLVSRPPVPPPPPVPADVGPPAETGPSLPAPELAPSELTKDAQPSTAGSAPGVPHVSPVADEETDPGSLEAAFSIPPVLAKGREGALTAHWGKAVAALGAVAVVGVLAWLGMRGQQPAAEQTPVGPEPVKPEREAQAPDLAPTAAAAELEPVPMPEPGPVKPVQPTPDVPPSTEVVPSAAAPSEPAALPPPVAEPVPGTAKAAAGPRALMRQARKLLRAGELESAEELYRQVLHGDPYEHHAMAGLATVHVRRREGHEAVRWTLRIIRKRAKRASYWLLHGDALALTGDKTGARLAWRAAARLDPDNKDAKRRLAQ